MGRYMAEKWKLEGTVFDACNCTTLCPCVYGQVPTHEDCQVSAAWHVTRGNYGTTKLDGLNFAGVFYSIGNPLMGVERAAMLVDAKAKPPQRKSLETILGGQAGGLFGMFAQGMKQFLGLTYAPFEYKNDQKSWSVKVDGTLEIQAGFLKPPPGLPFKSTPRKAQTYDPLFQNGEKVVGITERHVANLSGLTRSLSGTYSSAGRFAYKGP